MQEVQFDFTLINPPIALLTKDKLLTIASDSDAATLNLAPLQSRLYKRLTKKRKEKQLEEILVYTAEIFS